VSRTSSASESLPGIGPEFRAIPTCAPLYPTPRSLDATGVRGVTPNRTDEANARAGMTLTDVVKGSGRCPCQCHASMSFVAASPAKTSATPARARDSTERARVFGQSTPVSLASYDPDTSLWRTSQLSLLGGLEQFSETWPRSGMTRSGTAFQLQPLAPLTRGTASGLLPTPSATSYGSNQGGGAGRIGPVRHSLQSMARHNLWPTPRATDGDKGTRTQEGAKREMARGRNFDPGMVAAMDGGALNPTWVEWLMGFPLGWTDLGASETHLSRRSRSGSGTES
jgi:hypothetical protein